MHKYGVHQDRGGRPGTARGRVPADVDCRILALRGTGFLDAPADQSPRGRSLVDTSAWVEFSRGTGSAVDEQLSALIQDRQTNRLDRTGPHGTAGRWGADIRPGDRATSAVIRMVGVRPRK